MKKLWSKLLLVLLSVLLLCGLVAFASGAPSIYLMAVNDRVMELTKENMPMMLSNTLYIPYTMLSEEFSSVNLGVRAQYSQSRGTLNITNGTKTVTFDIRRNTAYLSSGGTTTARAMTRNAMAYVPVDWLCNYFNEISYSVLTTQYGILVRLINSEVALSDRQFVDAAASLLKDNMNRVLEESESIAPTVPSVEVPSPSPSPSPAPSPSLPPVTSLPPEPEPIADVYLAFELGEYDEEAADLLEAINQRGLFLFTIDKLIENDDFVRRLVGKGHQVGLVLQGNDMEDCLIQLEDGRELLHRIAYSPVMIVSADELSSQEKLDLRAHGVAVWEPTIAAKGLSQEALFRQIKGGRANYVEFTCDSDGYFLISKFLLSMSDENCQLKMALAPDI